MTSKMQPQNDIYRIKFVWGEDLFFGDHPLGLCAVP
jgi:hypothetical protein